MIFQQAAAVFRRTVQERIAEHVADDTRYVPRTRPLHVEFEIFPCKTGIQTGNVLRVVGIAQLTGLIVFIDYAVTVQVHKHGITVFQVNELFRERLAEFFFVQTGRVFVIETEEFVHIASTDPVSLLILVSIGIGRFLFLDNLILVVREVQRSPIAEVIVHLVIPVQGGTQTVVP